MKDHEMACNADGCGLPGRTDAPTITDAENNALIVEVFSDFICPWCPIAKVNLEHAIARLGAPVEVVFRPFELNPQMPREGMDRRTYRTRKFGSWERSLGLDAQVTAAAEQAGLAYDLARIQRTPNTRAAHRLAWLAGEHGRQSVAVDGLFRAYFGEGRDIGDTRELAAIATDASLPDVDSESLGEAEVAAHESRARTLGITGVPAFVIDGRVVATGALPPETLEQLLRDEVARCSR